MGSSVPVSCPVAVSPCTYDGVSAALLSERGSSGVTWTMQIPGLPTTGMSVGATTLALGSGNLSLAVGGTPRPDRGGSYLAR